MRVDFLKAISLGIIIFLVFLNVVTQLPRIVQCIYFLRTHEISPIGGEFMALRPYTGRLQQAGYITCRKSSHPLTDISIMGPYQQAQFVLSPLILDYFHPRHYRYIVLQCPDETARHMIEKKLSATIVAEKPEGIFLLDRGGR